MFIANVKCWSSILMVKWSNQPQALLQDRRSRHMCVVIVTKNMHTIFPKWYTLCTVKFKWWLFGFVFPRPRHQCSQFGFIAFLLEHPKLCLVCLVMTFEFIVVYRILWVVFSSSRTGWSLICEYKQGNYLPHLVHFKNMKNSTKRREVVGNFQITTTVSQKIIRQSK